MRLNDSEQKKKNMGSKDSLEGARVLSAKEIARKLDFRCSSRTPGGK